MLKAAIEQEVTDYINGRTDFLDEKGRRTVVRNGSLPEREILTGVGPVAVSQPRVRDKRSPDEREVFTPGIQNNMGLCYLNSGQWNRAEECFNEAIDIDPEMGVAYSNLCSLRHSQKRYKSGVGTGLKAVSLMGVSTNETIQAMAHNNLALCMRKTGQKPQSLEHIKKAIALAPTSQLFCQNLVAI
jgi:tetratricopeptide (TPR) repeat protein